MPVTRLQRSAAPWLGAEDANEAQATNPRTVTRRGTKKTTLFDIVNMETMRAVARKK
jgi:hypothetical protein